MHNFVNKSLGLYGTTSSVYFCSGESGCDSRTTVSVIEDTISWRRLKLIYVTLCGIAKTYRVDSLIEMLLSETTVSVPESY